MRYIFKNIIMFSCILTVIVILSDKSWAAPVNDKILEEKVQKMEEKLDSIKIENIVKSYKDSESSLYQASTKTLEFVNLIIVGLGGLTIFKYAKDRSLDKKLTKHMKEIKTNLINYQESVTNLESKIQTYEKEIETSKKEIDYLKDKVRHYADEAKKYAQKSEVENLKQNLKINNRDIKMNKEIQKQQLTKMDKSTKSNKSEELQKKAEILSNSTNSSDLMMAIKYYKELMEIDSPSLKRFHAVSIAEIYGLLGNYEESSNYFRKAESLGYKKGSTLYLEGLMYYTLKEFEKSRNCLKECLSFREDEDVYEYLAAVSEKLEEYEEAKYYYQKMDELKNRNLDLARQDALSAITSEE